MAIRIFSIIAIWIIVFASSLRAETNAMLAAAMESITSAECYEHVEKLADDVYEGREAGSRGGRAAATYIEREIAAHGLMPAGSKGKYLQSFGRDWRNILALLPGSDPELRDEVIVVGAHYDHVGYGNRRNSFGEIGTIHNGADDNASGTSVLLETIEASANSGLTARRSILFAFWDCEERGMVGSRHWVANPTLPLERVKLAVTLDMVGRMRDGRLYLLGTRSGYGMRRLLSGPVEEPLWLDFTWELNENSDHWTFLERRLPTVLLHTGLHKDYHRPSDDAHKINRDGMRDVSRYLLAMLLKVANEDRLPEFRAGAARETLARQRDFQRPLPKATLANWPEELPRPRLGIGWREDEAEPGSVFLIRVVEGTPAAAAGLAVHDRIYELNGRPFADAGEFQTAITGLLDAKTPELTLLTERRGQLRTVCVKLASDEAVAGSGRAD
jgi:hypothetical protein